MYQVRACLDVKLDPALCNAVMQALVVLDALDADEKGELVEVRQLAAVLAADWPTADGPFEAAMRVAWGEATPSSPSSFQMRLARALTERIRGVAARHSGGPTYASGLECLRCTLENFGGNFIELNPGADAGRGWRPALNLRL
tara:strand:+ start:337 stop:765 length:429 start_codon:yes stop_codon:yes gene_type:complete